MKAVGLEMEGAHYQKAIQSASRIRNSINPDVVVRYAYYASDNPLLTGHTLASGSLGLDGCFCAIGRFDLRRSASRLRL